MITCTFEHGARVALRHVVVHALVERDDRLLLVKRAPHLVEAGKWSLPGGFLELGETLAEGVLRELREETGWEGRVRALLRINSRPNRSQENVAFDFVVTPLEQRGEPDAESTAVEWMPIARLPPLETLAFDHGESVRAYLEQRQQPTAPPAVL